jgi:hypothetical protein
VTKPNLSATWSEALTTCRSDGAHLLVVDDSFYDGMTAAAIDAITQGVYRFIVQDPGSKSNWIHDEIKNAKMTNLL